MSKTITISEKEYERLRGCLNQGLEILQAIELRIGASNMAPVKAKRLIKKERIDKWNMRLATGKKYKPK